MLSIVIPVYNEEDLLERSALTVHDYLDERSLAHEIVVVDNGSTDQTSTIGGALAKRWPWFIFRRLEERGVGRAFREGVLAAQGEFIVSLDIDLPFDLRFMEYAELLLPHAEMVVGSKTMGYQKRAWLRVLGSQSYILCAGLLCNLTISDYSPGCKAYRRSAILPAISKLDSWTGYVLELCLFFRVHDRRVIQIGVDCNDQRKSKFNIWQEGMIRFPHLFRCYRMVQSKNSWFHSILPGPRA